MKKTTNLLPAGVTKYFVLLLLTFSALIGCSSNDDTTLQDDDNGGIVDPDPDTDPEPSQEMFYRVIRVENYEGSTSDENPTAPSATLYYSLESNEPMDSSYARTRKWDLAFGGLYASFLSGNNGTNNHNNGYMAGGVGGITIVEQPFDQVTDIPADSEFKTGVGLIGTDDAGAFGSGIGWYLYDFDGTIVGDSSEEKAHVAYALGEPLTLANGTVLPARTVIVKTANGNYAKIKMISVYKDVFTPGEWFKDTPHMYYTFEYVLVPAGSTQFEIH